MITPSSSTSSKPSTRPIDCRQRMKRLVDIETVQTEEDFLTKVMMMIMMILLMISMMMMILKKDRGWWHVWWGIIEDDHEIDYYNRIIIRYDIDIIIIIIVMIIIFMIMIIKRTATYLRISRRYSAFYLSYLKSRSQPGKQRHISTVCGKYSPVEQILGRFHIEGCGNCHCHCHHHHRHRHSHCQIFITTIVRQSQNHPKIAE